MDRKIETKRIFRACGTACNHGYPQFNRVLENKGLLLLSCNLCGYRQGLCLCTEGSECLGLKDHICRNRMLHVEGSKVFSFPRKTGILSIWGNFQRPKSATLLYIGIMEKTREITGII